MPTPTRDMPPPQVTPGEYFAHQLVRSQQAADKGHHQMRKALALLGIFTGLAVYIAACFINAPAEICISQPTPPAAFAPGTDSAVATHAISSNVWVVLVASRCELTYPATGLHTSDLIVEWGPSAIAITGLIAAASALWIWLGYRAKEAEQL